MPGLAISDGKPPQGSGVCEDVHTEVCVLGDRKGSGCFCLWYNYATRALKWRLKKVSEKGEEPTGCFFGVSTL